MLEFLMVAIYKLDVTLKSFKAASCWESSGGKGDECGGTRK